jgi:catechol 2,3-dioxygenase-like lactoylglutathione lyase family enzyme
MRLDSVRLTVVDVPAAIRTYRTLLGTNAVGMPDGVERFQLMRGAVEFVAGRPRTRVCFSAERGDDLGAWPVAPEDHAGLDVCVHSEPVVEEPLLAHDAVHAIDHIVVRTPDPERTIAHWRDQLGLRLSLDREFPDRRMHLLFFRSGGITLEFVTTLDEDRDAAAQDTFYGISYRVADIEACRERLLQAGLDVGEVHAGIKPGTRVASVRSGTVGVPTLLIEHPQNQ